MDDGAHDVWIMFLISVRSRKSILAGPLPASLLAAEKIEQGGVDGVGRLGEEEVCSIAK